MKAVIYSRVSTDSQDYTRQIEELTKIVKSHCNELVTVYAEKDSAVKDDAKRYELNKLLKAANNKEFEIVYFWEISRLYRNVFKTDKFLLRLEELGINAFFKEPQSLFLLEDGKRSFVADIQITLQKHIAEQESKIRSERQISGLKHKSKNNTLNFGTAPFGYIKENKLLKVDEDPFFSITGYTTKSETVKTIFELYRSGDSTRKIVKHLNDLSIKNGGKEWNVFNINYILNNTCYYGKRKVTIKGETFLQDNPSIISKELFEECLQQRKKNLHGKGATKRKTEALLQGKIICGNCGSRYSLNSYKYRCLRSQAFVRKCNNPLMKIEFFDMMIWNIIEKDYIRFNLIRNKEKLLLDVNLKIEQNTIKLNTVKEKIASTKKNIEKLIDALLSIGSDQIKNRLKNEEINLSKLNEEIEELERILTDNKIHKSKIETSNDEEPIKATTFEEKREAVNKFIDSVVVYKVDGETLIQIHYYNGVVLNTVYHYRNPLKYEIFDNSLFTLVPETNLFRVEGIKALEGFKFETLVCYYPLEIVLKMI